MSRHSEYGDHNPNLGRKLVTHLVVCFRDNCEAVNKVRLLEGDRPTKWKQCTPCKVKADNGYFDSIGCV